MRQVDFPPPLLVTAIAAGADLTITGDKNLFVLGSHVRIRIRSPRQFSDGPDA